MLCCNLAVVVVVFIFRQNNNNNTKTRGHRPEGQRQVNESTDYKIDKR